MTSVMFVCLGNICRSPLAEGIFRHKIRHAGLTSRFRIDSAGTGNWHHGKSPDPRSIDVATKYGIDIATQRARQVTRGDFNAFDIILAMDADNLATLRRLAPPTAPARLRLFIETPPQDVPDPYYGGAEGFETVYRIIEEGCSGLLHELNRV